jgi:prepilin peptidase CpaA
MKMDTELYYQIVFSIILVELIYLSIHDFLTKKIPNVFIIINIFLSILCLIFLKDKYVFEISHFTFSVAMLFLGFYLYKFDIAGAGDSKLVMSLFLLIPTNKQEIFLESLLIMTISMGIIFLFIKIVQNVKLIVEDKRDLKIYKKINYKKILKPTRVSFAPIIFFAWLMFGWIQKVYI